MFTEYFHVICYVLQRLFPGMIAGKKPCFPSKSVLYFTGYDRENSGEPHGREGASLAASALWQVSLGSPVSAGQSPAGPPVIAVLSAAASAAEAGWYRGAP